MAVIIVHGGAGNWVAGSRKALVGEDACRAAAKKGYELLQSGASAMDAVEIAVMVLEDSPALNAGFGSVLNSDGTVEADAMIMDGRDLAFGAVGAVRGVRNPVTLARVISAWDQHNLLVGEGALRFAREREVELCDPDSLISEFSHREDDAEGEPVAQIVGLTGDTVGAVALDNYGNLAAATSTGGTSGKHPGRVGDTPIIGAGGYAINGIGTVSTTGNGETLMRILAARQACDYVRSGRAVQEAVEATVDDLRRLVDGSGGLIMIGQDGTFGLAHNTPGMAAALIESDGTFSSGLLWPAAM